MNYLYLAAAIVSEVVATSALKLSNGMTRPAPAAVVVVGYLLALYLLSLTLRTIPVGVAYAIWSGVGVVLITVIGLVWFKQHARFRGNRGNGLDPGGRCRDLSVLERNS